MEIKVVVRLVGFFVLIFSFALSTFAMNGRTTYQAKIIKPDGYPLEASSVNFKFTILDPAGSCILYSETYSSVNMSSTGGLISFALGSGVKTYPASATTFEQVFSNITPSLSCDTGGPASYSPTATDIRKIVMQFHDGSGWQTLPAMSINAVPYAMYANEAAKLNGLTSSDFVQLSTVPTCTASEALRYTGASFSCVAVGSTASVTSSTVITALGYTPADGVSVTTLVSNVSSVSSTVFSVSSTVTSLQNSVAAIISSQWTTSGTNIFYNTGNVGVGTSTPNSLLQVFELIDFGADNTKIGYQAGKNAHASATDNVYIGYQAGYSDVSSTSVADFNTAVGVQSMQFNISGRENVAMGYSSLRLNTSGQENVAIGINALYSTELGSRNTALGTYALEANDANDNIAIGYNAGSRTFSGSANQSTSASIYIGVETKSSSNSNTNEIVIGSNLTGNGSNSVTLGNDSIIKTVLKGNVGIGTTTPASPLHVNGDIQIAADANFKAAGNVNLQATAGNGSVGRTARVQYSRQAASSASALVCQAST